MKTFSLKTIRLPVLLLTLFFLLPCALGNRDELKEVLQIRSGQSWADIGAGDGDWTESLVEWVGPEGRVVATEVDAEKVSRIQRRIERNGWTNVSAVLGNQRQTGLEAGCCDGALLRLVFHHFEQPDLMCSELFQAVKRNGLVAIIDFGPDSGFSRRNVPSFREGHGVLPEEVQNRMQEAGFVLKKRIDNWDGDSDRYLLLFQKQPYPPAGEIRLKENQKTSGSK
jgi:ubiquinone/menaquinone biosynthesis C-methylase UbiE